MNQDEVPQDVGDAKQVKHRRTKVKIRRDNELEEVRQLLRTPYGRKFLWRVISECGVFKTLSYDEELGMAIKSGRRDIGLWLLREIDEADKNGYLKLIQEDLNNG